VLVGCFFVFVVDLVTCILMYFYCNCLCSPGGPLLRSDVFLSVVSVCGMLSCYVMLFPVA